MNRVSLLVALALIPIVGFLTRDVSAQECDSPSDFAEKVIAHGGSVAGAISYAGRAADGIILTTDSAGRVLVWTFKDNCMVAGPLHWDMVDPGAKVKPTPSKILPRPGDTFGERVA